MATTKEPDDNQQDLADFQRQLDTAKKSSTVRGEKTDDLSSRFRELRRKNHFRLMLEEIFHD